MTAGPHHATCVIVGPLGILIRGPSASGKSALGDLLIEAARARGNYAALVGDDRIHLKAAGTRLLATPPATLAGLIEVRGFGILAEPFAPKAVVHLGVNLVPLGQIERLPAFPFQTERLDGIEVPHILLASDAPVENIRRVRRAIRQLFPSEHDYI